MEQKTLKYLRIFIPGVIFLLGFYPIYRHYFSAVYDVESLDITYLTYLSLIIGSIYYLLNIRYPLIYFSRKLIDKNIFNKLIVIHNALDESQKALLKEDENYMTVFYKIIDSDESLKRKGSNVYFNGIVWTSTADSVILTLVFAILYCYFPNIQHSDELSRMFFIICGVSLVLHIIAVRTHINLSNSQLKFMTLHKSSEVSQAINDVLLKVLDSASG